MSGEGQVHQPRVEAPQPAGGWLSNEQQCAWRSFQVMQTRLQAALAHDLALHSELSYQDYVVLVALTDQPGGELRLFQLGELVGWEKSRTSHQVTRMAERGLVSKNRCGADRRGATVAVTAAGWDAIRAAAPSHVDAVRRFFVGVLGADDLDDLARICRRVLAAVETQTGDACSGAPALAARDG